MSQATDWSVPLAGPVTPLAYSQRVDGSLDALVSQHRGTSRPDYAVAGTIWAKVIDATEEKIYYFTGSADIYIGRIDLTNGYFYPVSGGSENTAGGSEISSICDGAGVSTTPLFKTIPIGDWNMVANNQVVVAHSVDVSKIISVSGYVRNDAGTDSKPITEISISSYTSVVADRGASSITLDSYGTWTGYSAVDYNRGHIVIEYLA